MARPAAPVPAPSRATRARAILLVLATLPGLLTVPGAAQDAGRPVVARVSVEPASLVLDVSDSAAVRATAYDSSGAVVRAPIVFFSSSRRSLEVDSLGRLRAHRSGEYRVFAAVLMPGAAVRGEAAVTIRPPAIRTVEIMDSPARFYAGTSVRHRARVRDAADALRKDEPLTWTTDNDRVLRVDRFGEVTAVAPGTATLRVTAGGVAGTRRVTVVPNPTRALVLTASAESGRMGDVIRFTASAQDAAGRAIPDMPVAFAVRASVEDTVIAPGASAVIEPDGRFVAQRAGSYTVVATAGPTAASRSVTITHRHQSQRIAAGTGQGAVRDVHTSDIWVWTGADGRDYAVTGTWGANGVAYFWDVTDPASPALTDSLVVDARTVNDVKVDPERGICVITREGASNRLNGFVVLDCSNPRDVQVLSRFDDQLYGGVHNVFLWKQHVFAINAGRRFDIISIEDPRAPRRVSFFELDTPGHGIHDVWVVDGIAYSSNWADGVVLVDVGNGVAGGSLANPVKIGQYAYPIGATHSAFPYRTKEGRHYVFVGDEQFPYGLDPDQPDEAGGYIHVVDFTDVKQPKEIARYQIPEAGPHNFWVENDTLYVAYYNAGLRVVDVSGELMGNLYEQGRELARFEAKDPKGKVANSAMAWGPQPHKGHVFFSDFYSGLWSVKLPERPRAPLP